MASLCTCPAGVDYDKGEQCLLVDVPDHVRLINGGPDAGARVSTGDSVELAAGSTFPVVDYVRDFHQVLVDISGTGDQLVWLDLEDVEKEEKEV